MNISWLKDVRCSMFLSQKDAAALCGISKSYFSLLENGLRSPRPKTAIKIAAALKFDWTNFFQEVEVF
ncbi:MAG: helix-turn-helix domain-containing protein [Clostridiales bacterium]|jgi:transcriptional regulator with XRE-family HTH domain|nr:helix-turn-helix domain-containing protein [Clostridiales bacterium]